MQYIRLQPKGVAVAVAAALMVAGVAPAAAQDAGTKPDVKADAKPGEKPEAKTLDTLVVTVQKREELLQDVPVTVTACGVSELLPRPLVPAPSEMRPRVAVPVLTPTVPVLAEPPRPTVMLVVLVPVGPRRLIEPPFVVASPVVPENVASSFSL